MLEVLRGCRDHQDGCGKTLPLIADGNLPAELKTREWNTVAGSDPEPRRAFWPRKTGTNRGRSRPRCGFSRVRPNCSWFQLGSSGAATACSAVALDRDAERKVDRAFWSEGLTGRAFWHDKKSWLCRRWDSKPTYCRRKDGPKSASR